MKEYKIQEYGAGNWLLHRSKVNSLRGARGDEEKDGKKQKKW
jgi:hypothetical protein